MDTNIDAHRLELIRNRCGFTDGVCFSSNERSGECVCGGVRLGSMFALFPTIIWRWMFVMLTIILCGK